MTDDYDDSFFDSYDDAVQELPSTKNGVGVDKARQPTAFKFRIPSMQFQNGFSDSQMNGFYENRSPEELASVFCAPVVAERTVSQANVRRPERLPEIVQFQNSVNSSLARVKERPADIPQLHNRLKESDIPARSHSVSPFAGNKARSSNNHQNFERSAAELELQNSFAMAKQASMKAREFNMDSHGHNQNQKWQSVSIPKRGNSQSRRHARGDSDSSLMPVKKMVEPKVIPHLANLPFVNPFDKHHDTPQRKRLTPAQQTIIDLEQREQQAARQHFRTLSKSCALPVDSFSEMHSGKIAHAAATKSGNVGNGWIKLSLPGNISLHIPSPPKTPHPKFYR